MSNIEKKEKKVFRSYSKNLTQFLVKHGAKPIDSGTHYWGVRISQDNGINWDDYVSISDAIEDYGEYLTSAELTDLRDESLKTDKEILLPGTNLLVRKRVRFYKAFDYAKIESLLKVWKDTKPNK